LDELHQLVAGELSRSPDGRHRPEARSFKDIELEYSPDRDARRDARDTRGKGDDRDAELLRESKQVSASLADILGPDGTLHEHELTSRLVALKNENEYVMGGYTRVG
jgi:hypothetical protein